MTNKTISRRVALASGLLALLNAADLRWRWSQANSKTVGGGKHVIVIGAGLAGLVCAYELEKRGFRVTVLEAQQRVGGRVLTLREPFSKGLHAEAGAARIYNSHILTLRYASLFKLPLEPFLPAGKRVVYARGKRFLADQQLQLSELYQLTAGEQAIGPEGITDKKIEPTARKVRFNQDALCSLPELRKLDSETYYDFLHGQGISGEAIDLLSIGFSNPEKERESALAELLQEGLALGVRSVQQIVGGNDRLPKAFASALKNDVIYGAQVKRVAQHNSGVSVECTLEGKPRQFKGDFVVCAVPLPLVRQIEFAPSLSDAKATAIKNIPYASAIKAFFETKNKFWSNEGLNGFANTDFPAEIWQSAPNTVPSGLLVAYTIGHSAKQLEDQPEQALLKQYQDHINKVFPGLKSNVLHATTKIWDHDKWAGGAYVQFAPRQFCGMREQLAKSEGRILFTGEHNSLWFGWMQGALDSGLHCATELAALVKS